MRLQAAFSLLFTCVASQPWEDGGTLNYSTDHFPWTAIYGFALVQKKIAQWEDQKSIMCFKNDTNGNLTIVHCHHACVLQFSITPIYNETTKKYDYKNQTNYDCQDLDTYPPNYHHVCSNMQKEYPNVNIYFDKRTLAKTHLYCCRTKLCNRPGTYHPIEAHPFTQIEHGEMQDYDTALFVVALITLATIVIWPFFILYRRAKEDEWVEKAFNSQIERAVQLMEYKPQFMKKEDTKLVTGQLTFNEFLDWFLLIQEYETVVSCPRRMQIHVVDVHDFYAGGNGHDLAKANRKTWVRYDNAQHPERATMQTILEHGPYAYDWKPIDLVELFDQAKELFNADEILVEISLPVVVIGDIRGSYQDLWRWLQLVGIPPTTKLLFLGGVIDPEESGSLDCLALIAVMKVAFPQRVFMLRGVPESMKINFGARYGEVNDAAVQSAATRLCCHLPIACRIHLRILAVHSGISHLLTDYESFDEVKRPFDLEQMPLLARQLIFNEPTTRIKMYREDSDTGIGHFGFQAVSRLCREIPLSYIIRSRHYIEGGIMWNDRGRLISLWSAPGKVLKETDTAEKVLTAECGAVLLLDTEGKQTVYRLHAQL